MRASGAGASAPGGGAPPPRGGCASSANAAGGLGRITGWFGGGGLRAHPDGMLVAPLAQATVAAATAAAAEGLHA